MTHGPQCLGSQCSGRSRWVGSGVPTVRSSCHPVQCGWQPGDGGLDEVPLHQGWERPGTAPGSGISERPSVLPSGAWGGDGAVQAAELQETAGSFSSPVCWCVRGGRWRPGQQRVGPTAAGPRWAASYVQFITEKDSGSATGPAAASGDPGQGQSMSTEERPSYKGPLNWFPDRCCRMEGLELAASPSFLQTTCEQRRDVSGGPTEPPTGLHTHFASLLFKITYVPRATGQVGKLRPRDIQTRPLHTPPHGQPWDAGSACGCPVEPMEAGGSVGGGSEDPLPGGPGSAPVNPLPLAPARVQRRHVSMRWVRGCLPGNPAMRSIRVEGPTCACSLSTAPTRGTSQLGGQEPDTWARAEDRP